jgi:hypothetical protein
LVVGEPPAPSMGSKTMDYEKTLATPAGRGILDHVPCAAAVRRGGGTMQRHGVSRAHAVGTYHRSRRLRCAMVAAPLLLVTACTSHRTAPAAASAVAATPTLTGVASSSPAAPAFSSPASVPTGLALPTDLRSRVRTVDPWLPGGQLARCLQTTPDGGQLLCESMTPGAAGGADPMVAMIALNVQTDAVTVLRHNAVGEESDVVEAADADATWIVWVQDHDGPDPAALVDWTIYVYDRATGVVHVASEASAFDVAHRTAVGTVQPRLANGRVWWGATVSGSDGTACTCTYSAPAAGGALTVEAVNTRVPQPVRGRGAGPEGTTVYVERPSGAGTVVGAQLNPTGQALPTVSGGDVIAGFAAGAAGLAWQGLGPPSEISFAGGPRATPKVIGSLDASSSASQESVRSQLAVGDRYVVWTQGPGAMLYDTNTGELYQTTLDNSLTNANGSAVMWGDALDASDMRVPDDLALRYSVLTDPT